MTDLPPGDWSALLVGHQWPGSTTLAVLSAAAATRSAVMATHDMHADALRSVRAENLDVQDGIAADAARELFRTGEQNSRAVAAKNRTKHSSYQIGHQAVSQLRSDLELIAEQGNAAIRRVIGSRDPAAAKQTAITAIVVDAQQQANMRAASRCAEVYAAIRDVLDAEPAGQCPRDFARRHGVELPAGYGSPVTGQVAAEVRRMVERIASP